MIGIGIIELAILAVGIIVVVAVITGILVGQAKNRDDK